MPSRRNSYVEKFVVAGPSRGSMSPIGANPPHSTPSPSKKRRVVRWSRRSKIGLNNSGDQFGNDGSNNNRASNNVAIDDNNNIDNANTGSSRTGTNLGNNGSNSGSNNVKKGSNNSNSGPNNSNSGSSSGNGGSNSGNSGSNNGSSGSNSGSSNSNSGNSGSNGGNNGSKNANSGSNNANGGSPPTPTADFPPSKPTPNFFCPQCIVQDNNPNVYYNGTWVLNAQLSSTTHSTTVSGSTISLRFNGSGIVVFGTVPASNDTFEPPTAVYTIDQDPPFSTTLPRAAKAIPNQPLFASGQHLSDDEHQLVINVTTVSAPYSLANFFVMPRGSGSKDMIGQPPTGGVISHSSILPTPTPTITSSTPQLASPDSSNGHHKEKVVKTLAGVLGTIAFLMLTIVTAFYFFRRRVIAKRKLALMVNARPDTVYTSFTSTESILRNDSGFWSSPLRSPRSQYARSDVRSYGSRASDTGQRSTIDFVPPPLPPKPDIFLSSRKPG
ncbi:hypothetical protein GALMADRAFT_208230 [Galerina marginata CBS 339.88]|uniref:Uncharacterized protein n=1 Tax=Galerina marginata (strain CBS 339.88) TaxID=685588 RepID=A0A067TA53_GALM3|nr:hypothetical protein GALMADRAFT_208230 [Galerina marginata CBS 339.88]